MRTKTALMSMLALVGLAEGARADMSISEAQYAAGVTVVRGLVDDPGARVTLDRRYATRARRSGRFVFRVRYLPDDCTVDIRSGGEHRTVTIRNCAPTGVEFRPRPRPVR